MSLLLLDKFAAYLAAHVPSSLRVVTAVLMYSLFPSTHGVGTMFDSPEVDSHNQGTLACVSHGTPDHAAKSLIRRGLVVAHKSLPCYQLIYVCVVRNGKCSVAVVADRGPLHADMDLFHDLAVKLRHNGLEEVEWKKIFLRR